MDDANFWAPRRCFTPPIPELEAAADLLSECADSLLKNDRKRASEAARAANIPAVWTYAARIMGATDRNIHRRRPTASQSAVLSGGSVRIPQRMPSEAKRLELYSRDGFRCRFCGSKIIAPIARRVLVRQLPDDVIWSGPDRSRHAALYCLSATPDHVVPHSAGGDNSAQNLVTTCQPCNFGRNNWTLQEVGLLDPRAVSPMVDDWDGLTRLTSKDVKWSATEA